jgi:hypothetical protein
VHILGGEPGQIFWIQPNRTEGERTQRNRVNCFLSFLHKIREDLDLDKYWMRKGYQATVIKGIFKEGFEKASWKGVFVGKMSAEAEAFALEPDQALSEAFASDFSAKGKQFEAVIIRQRWEEHLAAGRSTLQLWLTCGTSLAELNP